MHPDLDEANAGPDHRSRARKRRALIAQTRCTGYCRDHGCGAVRFRSAGGADCAPAREPARFRAASRRARGRFAPACACPRSAGLLRARDALVVNDTKVIPARLRGRRVPRAGAEGQGPSIEMLLHKRLSPSRFLAFARPARKLVAGDELASGSGHCARQCLMRGEAGEMEIEFDLCRRGARCCHRARRRDAVAALYRRQAQGRCAGCARLPDHLCAIAKARSRRRRPGLHFTPELVGAAGGARASSARTRNAACRRRHVPAGQRRRHDANIACMPNGPKLTQRRPTPQCRARAGRAHRRRGHDLAAHAGKRRGCGRACSRRFAAKPISSSRPAIASGRRMCCSPISICRARRCSCWSAPSCGMEMMKHAYAEAIARALSFLFLWRCLSAIPARA